MEPMHADFDFGRGWHLRNIGICIGIIFLHLISVVLI